MSASRETLERRASRLTDRERLLRAIPEKEWTNTVVDLAVLFRWRVYHSRPAWIRDGRMVTALQGHAGFPDVLMLRGSRSIVAELKRQHGGELTLAQDRWLEAFRQSGYEAYVWRPGDQDLVQKILDPALQCRPGLELLEHVTSGDRA